jgi:hypothetical protein
MPRDVTEFEDEIVPAFDFKFHFLNDDGEQASFLAKKGHLSDEELVLDGDSFPIGAIIDTDVRGQFLVLSLATEGEPTVIVIKTAQADALKSDLGVLRSDVFAAQRQKELTEKGEGQRFRKLLCPNCRATLDLTDMPETPQVHCEFCHTISNVADPHDHDSAADPEDGYRLCDECGMYSLPRKFTIFYFYFLLVVYGWSSRETWRCPGCMRGEAWKMFFGNLIFVLGVPVALIQLFRAYGGADGGARIRGLDSANLKASNGDVEAAVLAYKEILGEHPVSAGVKYNIALAFLHQERIEEAVKILEFSLADCSNYLPAASLLAGCYEQLGRTEELAALNSRWGSPDEEDENIFEAEEDPMFLEDEE